jgi:[ribosomal protein S5]-alanine N-acetyltransferase
MQFTSKRLILQIINKLDIDNIHALHSIPETDQYNTMGIPNNINDTKIIMENWLTKMDNQEAFVFKILDKNSNQFIGLTGVNIHRAKLQSGEIWYKMNKQFWHNGFATEAVNALIQYLFIQLNMHRIEAACSVHNLASVKVLEKVGMHLEGRTRQKLPIGGLWHDSFLYAILQSDFTINELRA